MFCILPVLEPKLAVFVIAEVVTKYSNFVSFPIFLNGRRLNTLQVRRDFLLFVCVCFACFPFVSSGPFFSHLIYQLNYYCPFGLYCLPAQISHVA